MKTSQSIILSILIFVLFNVLFIISVPVYAAFPDGYEPDDNFLLANPIWNGPAQSHSISPVGDEDWVMFNLPREAGVFIETSGIAGTHGCGFTTAQIR